MTDGFDVRVRFELDLMADFFHLGRHHRLRRGCGVLYVSHRSHFALLS